MRRRVIIYTIGLSAGAALAAFYFQGTTQTETTEMPRQVASSTVIPGGETKDVTEPLAKSNLDENLSASNSRAQKPLSGAESSSAPESGKSQEVLIPPGLPVVHQPPSPPKVPMLVLSPQPQPLMPLAAPTLPPMPVDRGVQSSLLLEAMAGFSELVANYHLSGIYADLVSRSDLAARAGLRLNWSESWVSEVTGQYRTLNLAGNNVTTYSRSQISLKQIQAKIEKKVAPPLTAILGASYEDKISLGSVTNNVISIDSYQVPSLGVGIDYEFLRRGNLSAQIIPDVRFYLPAKSNEQYTTKAGYGYGLTLALMEDRDDHPYKLAMSYLENHVDTDFSSQVESQIFLTLSVSFLSSERPPTNK